jgi:hypothetical protein
MLDALPRWTRRAICLRAVKRSFLVDSIFAVPHDIVNHRRSTSAGGILIPQLGGRLEFASEQEYGAMFFLKLLIQTIDGASF